MAVPLKVLVKSPFSLYSGYGQDGFGLVRALHKWGCDVYPQPTWVDVPIPADLLPLFGRTLHGPFDLTINHWDPAHLKITEEARKMTRCAVAHTMWEFSPPPSADPVLKRRRDGTEYLAQPKSGLFPHGEGRSTLRKRLGLFDLVLGYDSVSLASLEPFVPRHVARGQLQGGFEAADWPYFGDRDWFTETDFMFIMHGALGARKAPWTAIQAFNELKIEKGEEFAGAKFGLHTTVPDVNPSFNDVFAERRIKIFHEVWDQSLLLEFYRQGHCLLTPSRGEGKNLPALEFQSTGGVVIATNYGGHTVWLNSEYAYPLDFELKPTVPGHPDGAHDARVRVQDLKDAIWHVYTHREEARHKASMAAKIIPAMCDWAVVVENLFRRIRDLVPHNGQLIYDMAQACRNHDGQ